MEWKVSWSISLICVGAIIVLCLLGIPDESSGRTITVDDDNTANFHTIQEALNASEDGDALDDFSIDWVKIRLDDGPWIPVEQKGTPTTAFTYVWDRGQLTPDAHSITVRTSDGFDVIQETQWVQVDLFYDLSIVYIGIPATATEGEWVNFTIIVKNTGPYASPAVRLILNIGTIMRTVDDLVLPANSEHQVMISWLARPGNHSVSVEINPSQRNMETDPSNNMLTGEKFLVTELSREGGSDDDGISGTVMIAVVVMILLGLMAAGVIALRSRGVFDSEK